MGLRKVKTKIRQAQIVEAALEAIGKNGFKGLTISSIARKVGIADGNVYRHFKDKGAVLEAIISGVGITLKRIVKESCKEERDSLSCLEKVFTKHISFLEDHRGIPRIIFSDEMYSGNKKLALKLKGSVTEYLGEIKKILRQGIKDEHFDCNLDIDAAAIAFVWLIQSTALQWVLFDYSFSPKARGKKVWQIYLKGILSGR